MALLTFLRCFLKFIWCARASVSEALELLVRACPSQLTQPTSGPCKPPHKGPLLADRFLYVKFKLSSCKATGIPGTRQQLLRGEHGSFRLEVRGCIYGLLSRYPELDGVSGKVGPPQFRTLHVLLRTQLPPFVQQIPEASQAAGYGEQVGRSCQPHVGVPVVS